MGVGGLRSGTDANSTVSYSMCQQASKLTFLLIENSKNGVKVVRGVAMRNDGRTLAAHEATTRAENRTKRHNVPLSTVIHTVESDWQSGRTVGEREVLRK